jgi:hypothetical protein
MVPLHLLFITLYNPEEESHSWSEACNLQSAALQRCSSEKHAGIKSENSLTPREVPQTQLPQHAKDTEADGPCHDLASDT